MNPEYFGRIDRMSFVFIRIGDTGRFNRLIADVELLGMLSKWLQSWYQTLPDDDDEDESRRESLRSIIVSFKQTWPDELKAFSLFDRYSGSGSRRLTKEEEEQEVELAAIELEANIQQTKRLIVGWNLDFSMLSSLLYYKPRNYYLSRLRRCIKHLVAEFDILDGKISFIQETTDSMYEDDKYLPFLNFARDFANTAAFLSCFYWVRQADDEADDEEIATEMNNLIFDSMQKLVPFVLDILPLYIHILDSSALHTCHSIFLVIQAVERSVDFFFGHLQIVVFKDDDFVVLRNHLIFIFTFLFSDPSPPPREDADETHLIRNQIYTLLVRFHDVPDKNMVLHEFVIKIEMLAAKARQLYYGSSRPCLKLEIEQMGYTYFVSLHKELDWIEKHSEWDNAVIDQVPLYAMELRCLRVFLLCFATWDDSDKDINMRLKSLILSFQDIWEKEQVTRGFARRLHAVRFGDHIATWHPLASELEEKIQLSKLQVKARWVNSVYWSPLTSYEVLKFMDSTIECLNDLVSFKASQMVSFKKQVETLEAKLIFLRNLFKLATICMYSKELEEFKLLVQLFSNDAICLTFLYWASDTNEITASETNNTLSQILQKIKPATPHQARLYFEALKAIYLQRSDSLMFGQTAIAFIDFLLEDPPLPLKKDFQILRDDIVFLLSFLNDPPPSQNAEEVIDVNFWEGFYGLLPFDDLDADFFHKKGLLLRDFMKKIDTINVNIRRIYVEFPDCSVYNFPEVISPLFLDHLIQDLRNLKERMNWDRKYAPFAKYKIIKIQEELDSLRPFFNYVAKQYPLQRELKETWVEVVGFVHITEHTINSCISSWFVFDHPIWYHMARLSDLIVRINVVKTKLEKVKENTMNNEGRLPLSTTIVRTFSEQVAPSTLIETFVGFKDEAEEIMGMLTCEFKPLDIVSVVGMGGLGKTTLAKHVYGSVKGNFDVSAFCTVSQDPSTKRLLVDIRRDIMGDDKRWSDLSVDELAHQLWKSLSRRKFLIVLDDIWDASAWNGVKSSFPDDKNGSRVMLTTRSHEVANNCTINCSPYHLRFMSDVESYELLQKKVFHDITSPPYLSEVGKQIAKNCKGLPLAVVVIAGLLANTEKSMSWWSEVAERVYSYLPDKDCIRILELSYNNLPETLKPCLLYLGAFEEDVRISVKKVILLWIAEGFVQESETKCIEDVAKGYLQDLLDRNLIIEDRKISDSHLKGIHVHDSIHELCQKKCREANFIQVYHNTASSSSLDLSINNKIRLSMQSRTDLPTVVGSPASIVRSLLLLSEKYKSRFSGFPYRGYRLVQVLHLHPRLSFSLKKLVSSLIHLKYLDAGLYISIPQSILNIWNIRILRLIDISGRHICFPEAFWRMNSLRHVKIKGHDEHEGYPVLDKVVSFSKPAIDSGKDVQWLLQRLPAVRKLSCELRISPSNGEESIEVVDFHSKLESLILIQCERESRYLINFPPTLKKLTLKRFHLLWVDISAIAELHCLEVLKLDDVSIQETRLEMEDLVFRNLKFFDLYDSSLVEWNACTESLPCLEKLVIRNCEKLEELPSCFGELSTLKGIEIVELSDVLSTKAFRIQEEQMELGIKFEVSSQIYSRRRVH